jgi:hypothetical protein
MCEPQCLTTIWASKASNSDRFTFLLLFLGDCLCGLVVRVPGYRSRGPGFDSWRYQIFWEVVGLEWGPLSLVSTIEELLGLENREYGRGDPLRWPRDTLCPQKLALTLLTNGGRSVGIVLLQSKATEFVVLLLLGMIFSTLNMNQAYFLKLYNEIKCWIYENDWNMNQSVRSLVNRVMNSKRYLLGYNPVYCGRSLPIFRKNILPPS